MRDHEDRDNTAPRIAALALSMGALAVPLGVAGAAQLQEDQRETVASQAAQDALSEVRLQFETAFRPGVFQAEGEDPGIIVKGNDLPEMIVKGNDPPGMIEW